MSVRRKGDEYAILADCVKRVGGNLSSTEAIDTILKSVSSLFGESPCSLLIPEDNLLEVVAAHDPTDRGSIVGLKYSIPNSITANVASTGISANTTWEMSSQPGDRPLFRSLLAAPIGLGSTVRGVLSIDSTSTGAFSDDDLPLLEPYLALLEQPISKGVPADDIHKTLSRMRAKQVLVLGKDAGDEYRYMLAVANSLKTRGYKPLLVKEFPDFRELSNEDKVRVFADVSRFVMIENSFAAGQIAECKICSTNRIVTAMLRQRQHGSTYMVTDYSKDFDFMNEFVYENLDGIDAAVSVAVQWAEAKVEERGQYFDSRYPWRQS